MNLLELGVIDNERGQISFPGGRTASPKDRSIHMNLLANKRVIAGLSVVVTLSLSACGSGSTPSASPSNSNISPSASPSESAVTVPAEMFYVADTGTDLVMFSEIHQVPESSDLGLTALQQLVDGTAHPLDPEYSTLWGNGSRVNSVTREGDVATVDLTLGKLNLGSSAEGRAIDQIVWTLTAVDPSVKSVKLTVDGKTVESIAGHVDATGTFTRAETFEILAAVAISSPTQNEVVSNPVVIKGQACTFEANVVWELLQNGDVVKSGSTTAAEACPTRSEWSVDLGQLDAGSYVIRAFDLSAKDGSLVVEDTKDFTVQ